MKELPWRGASASPGDVRLKQGGSRGAWLLEPLQGSRDRLAPGLEEPEGFASPSSPAES